MNLSPKPLVIFSLLGTLTSMAETNPNPNPDPNPNPGNPIVETLRAADPDVHVWDDVVWMYCSQDQPPLPGATRAAQYSGMDGYHVFSSTDLVNWTDHGEILHSRDVPWGIEGGGYMFAPGAGRLKKPDGSWSYLLYFPHRDKPGGFRIGVAVADHPAGPFAVQPEPIPRTHGIDPMCFVDRDGTAYLYWGGMQVARLTEDGLGLAEAPRKIEGVADTFFEGVWVFRKGENIYYTYTGKPFTQGHYGIGDSPYGPFEYVGTINTPAQGAQDHHAIVPFRDRWFYFYHTGDFTNAEGETGRINRRNACVDELFFDENGRIREVQLTRDGVKAVE